MNQRRKGATAEREIANLLHGKWLTVDGTTVTARRGQQFSGSPDSPDVVHNIPMVHLEVTRAGRVKPGTEAMTDKLAQAERDCPAACRPYVVWRPDGDTTWRVTFMAVVNKYGIVPARNGQHEVTITLAAAAALWGLQPTEQSFAAIGPIDITGGEPSEDYVRRMRD